MPYPVADTSHNFFPSLVGLLECICHDKLMTIVPIPFPNFVFPIAAEVMGISLAMRVHKRTHEISIVEGLREDGGNVWEVLCSGKAKRHSGEGKCQIALGSGIWVQIG